ncbi:hypothetical protein HELRODRAFT_82074, partial [Helobdella robusta]|uniref:DH domain-containing protein n=1 Tax=Helobdella robusta TaxID=6412 RepID=T1G4M5_HELRO
ENELTFYAGDVIEVVCCGDNMWWKGRLGEEKLGWFPRFYVEVNGDGDSASHRNSTTLLSSSSSSSISSSSLSCDTHRRHVIIDVIKAENDYVKHLDDIVEGFMMKCLENRKLFTEEDVEGVFSNIKEIRTFAKHFLHELLKRYDTNSVECTCFGKCFIENKNGFELYSTYCINHPTSSHHLASLNKIKNYKEFFEKCRKERAMIEINLDGFLLTPVQKICKYPLQLKQLLRFTCQQHNDYNNLKMAIEIMKNIVVSINEMKRQAEHDQKLLRDWQKNIVGWQGSDVIVRNSNLVHSGELIKVSERGWSHQRVCFLFNKEIVICKKDLLWRNILLFKNRYNLKDITVFDVLDGKDEQTGLMLKTCFRLYLSNKNEHQIWMCKNENFKKEWLTVLRRLL